MKNNNVDFSHFKNSELKYYLDNKNSKKMWERPLFIAFFSFFLTTWLYSIQDEELKCYILENIPFINRALYVPSVFALFLVPFLIIFILSYKFIFPFLLRWKNNFYFKKNLYPEKYYSEKYKFEVVNQLALAISLYYQIHFEYLEEKENQNKFHLDYSIENHFYIDESFLYLYNSINVLFNEIIYSPYLKNLKNSENEELNVERVEKLLTLSEELLLKIKNYWKIQGFFTRENKMKYEKLKMKIKGIKNSLNIR